MYVMGVKVYSLSNERSEVVPIFRAVQVEEGRGGDATPLPLEQNLPVPGLRSNPSLLEGSPLFIGFRPISCPNFDRFGQHLVGMVF